MRLNQKYFMKVSREIWKKGLSNKAIVLYLWLHELEQQYSSEDFEYFFRSDKQLANDMKWDIKTLQAAKKELKTAELIMTGKHHFTNSATGKKSESAVTKYMIL